MRGCSWPVPSLTTSFLRMFPGSQPILSCLGQPFRGLPHSSRPAHFPGPHTVHRTALANSRMGISAPDGCPRATAGKFSDLRREDDLLLVFLRGNIGETGISSKTKGRLVANRHAVLVRGTKIQFSHGTVLPRALCVKVCVVEEEPQGLHQIIEE